MAAICQKWSSLFCAVVVAMSSFLSSTDGSVHEIPNKSSLEKFIKGKLFALTFVDSHTCTRCRILYPFYVAAAQMFPHDPEIFFTRTHDKQLVKEWGVTELPALVYHLDGLKSFQTLDIDITVDDIIDTIARILHGNFGGLTRTYHVRVDDKVFDELLVTPKQNAFLLLHDKKDREEKTNIERVAYAFRKDDAILFATLDVSKYAGLRDERFKTRQTPVLMWFSAHEKDSSKRFGAVLSAELITKFVNERTGLHRDVQGTILSEAGRIPDVDEILRENIEDIVDGDSESMVAVASAISSLKGNVEEHHEQVLEYYLYVIDNIALAESTSVLQQLMRSEEDRLYGEEELSTKTKEVLKRRQNLLIYLQSLVDACNKDRSTRPNELEKARLEKKKLRGRKQTEVMIEDTSRPAHTHSEL